MMAGTRSSARQASSSGLNSSQDHQSTSNGMTGTKRKSDEAVVGKAKRGRKAGKKQQKTLEQVMPDKDEEEAMEDVEIEDSKSKVQNLEASSQNTDAAVDDPIKDREDAVKAREDAVKEKEDQIANKAEDTDRKKPEGNDVGNSGQDTQHIGSASTPEKSSKMDSTGKVELEEVDAKGQSTNSEGDAVEKSSEREESTPSSILEKGIIYFFFRGRVGINEPSDVGDIARSYLVLRPLPHGAKLGDGPIGDAGNNRLLALPKKVLPVSPRDRFMIFVEKANSSMDDIRTSIASSDYVTQTAGARHTPAATPIGEGVYAITTTGRESHLAYILTIPSELSEVQRDVGLRERGSFVTSVKNPQYAGPANTNLPQGPNFPQE